MRWAFALLTLTFLVSAAHAYQQHWGDQQWISLSMAVMMAIGAWRARARNGS